MRLVGAVMIAGALSSAALGANAATASDWKPSSSPLSTRWAKDVSPDKPHPEYPRPQMVRKDWLNLNGLWDLAVQDSATSAAADPATNFPEKILVPFPVESSLSGVGKRADHICYRRRFSVPKEWGGRRVMLRFEAVDWEAQVYVNGKKVGEHKGGYDPFSFDITANLIPDQAQELVVSIYDPSNSGDQPRGKQVKEPKGIWYTPSTGIWQTVWLEPLPIEAAIREVNITPDVDGQQVKVQAFEIADGEAKQEPLRVRATVLEGDNPISTGTAALGKETKVTVPMPRLWSPESPYLYNLRLELERDGKVIDTVESYFGMRKIERRQSGKFQRIFLNNKEIFQVGPLDQGFWPDGLHTAPTDEALRSDIELIKKLGFNMARKHIKVEPRRWYYWCDKLGLLVWQDMPSGNNKTPEAKEEYETELRHMIAARRNSPCIVMWVVFNEGWGQFDTERLTALVQQLDPTRLVNNASGWTDKGVGDVIDMHKYPGPGAPEPEANRASVLGEFGGLGLPVQGHMWSSEHWGYQGTSSTEHLTRRYEQLLRRVYMLKEEKGLCAAVYTQITDVETETNGIVTYDREFTKIDPERAANANRGELTPVEISVVVPTSEKLPATWRYTTTTVPKEWVKPEFNDSSWKQGQAGFGGVDTGGKVGTEWKDKDIWLRRNFDLPANVHADDLYLLVWHDDDVEIYLNGVSAVREKGYRTGFEEMPIADAARATLKPGKNMLAVHCRHTERGQFIDVGLIAVREKQ